MVHDVSENLTERFVDGIILEASGCWGHKNKLQPTGYLLASIAGRHVWAHRATYEAFVGPIPPGLQIDHLCRNRACLNPAHMEAVTQHENWIRGMSPFAVHARKTACIHGHAFDEANTHITPAGRRCCRRCRADRHLEYYYRDRAA